MTCWIASGVCGFDEMKIACLIGKNLREFAMVDAVGVRDDFRSFGLAENFGQAGDADEFGGDEIAQNGSRADAGKLVDIADENDPRAARNGAEQGKEQRRIDHARFIDDDQIAGEGIVPRALKAAATSDPIRAGRGE